MFLADHRKTELASFAAFRALSEKWQPVLPSTAKDGSEQFFREFFYGKCDFVSR